MTAGSDPRNLWHPIATSADLCEHHVFHGQLLGRELALWRADDHYVNVWENRCLHRGVRLSIGSSDGKELTCQYHGWRYANRSAGCTYIPAHPADSPARRICNRVFPCVERYGLIWSGEDPIGDPPTIDVLETGTPFGLRNFPVNASVEVVIEHLQHYRFEPSCCVDDARVEVHIDALSEWYVGLTSVQRDLSTSAIFYVQPVDTDRSVIRGVLTQAPPNSEELDVLRHHASQMTALVEEIEAAVAFSPPGEPMAPTIEPVPVDLSGPSTEGATTADLLRVEVHRKSTMGLGIVAFEFVPLAGVLPTFSPGAHIDVHLPNGLVRQYSLTNGPGETSSYRIGVKLEPKSTGGSVCLHNEVKEGDILAVSEPRSNFVLRRDSTQTVLIAGGIGVTPLLAMAQALHAMKLDHHLHYFVRTRDHLAFPRELEILGDALTAHIGLSAENTAVQLKSILREYQPTAHVYICGPGPMLDTARSAASASGWPDQAVHFEYFKNTTQIDDSSSFEITLARSGLTVVVPSGRTILEVLRDNGVPMPSSCEQGACGTCITAVLDGTPDHQDVFLNASEREAGAKILPCVSRSKTPQLVLDV